jgi:hypothetical protein
LKSVIKKPVLPAAAKVTIAAATAKIISNPLMVAEAGMGTGAGREAGAAAARGAAGAAAEVRGAAGACAGAAAVLRAGAGAEEANPLGAPGGNVGSLMVGAAEGLGGKLMRTVSFLGWTLPVSFFGGTAPPGMLGMFSAINLQLTKNLNSLTGGVKRIQAFSSISSRRAPLRSCSMNVVE